MLNFPHRRLIFFLDPAGQHRLAVWTKALTLLTIMFFFGLYLLAAIPHSHHAPQNCHSQHNSQEKNPVDSASDCLQCHVAGHLPLFFSGIVLLVILRLLHNVSIHPQLVRDENPSIYFLLPPLRAPPFLLI